MIPMDTCLFIQYIDDTGKVFKTVFVKGRFITFDYTGQVFSKSG